MKCPKCNTILVIPGAVASDTSQTVPMPKPPVAPTATAPPKQQIPAATMSSLFDEEAIGVAGPSAPVGGQSKPCPNCRKLAWNQAVVCVECGWNFAEGRLLETKRAPVKKQSDNPYGFDEYYQHDDGMYTSKRRGSRRDSGDRRGPAWESDDNPVTKYFQTVLEILVTPHFAFRNMRWYGGLGGPIYFVVTGYVISFLISMLLRLAWFAMTGDTLLELPRQLQPEERAAFGMGMICSMVVGAGCVMIAGAIILPLPMIIFGAIAHFCLFIVGGAKQSFEATFRAHGYVFGAMVLPFALLEIVPLLAFVLGTILQVGYSAVAVKYTHEIEWWRAIIATLVWFIVASALTIGLIVLIVVAAGISLPGNETFGP